MLNRAALTPSSALASFRCLRYREVATHHALRKPRCADCLLPKLRQLDNGHKRFKKVLLKGEQGKARAHFRKSMDIGIDEFEEYGFLQRERELALMQA